MMVALNLPSQLPAGVHVLSAN